MTDNGCQVCGHPAHHGETQGKCREQVASSPTKHRICGCDACYCKPKCKDKWDALCYRECYGEWPEWWTEQELS